MNKKLIFATVATIGIIGLAGCGSSASSQQAQTSAQGSASDQGSSQGSDANKTTSTSTTAAAGDAAKGKQVFDQSCAGCHSTGTDQVVGPGLKGIAAQPTIVADGKPMNTANLIEWVKAGGTGKIGNMPGMGGTLSEQQIADVVAYVQSLK